MQLFVVKYFGSKNYDRSISKLPAKKNLLSINNYIFTLPPCYLLKIIFSFLVLIPSISYSQNLQQTGLPFIKEYSVKSIGHLNVGTQFWDMTQDASGIVYFGNSTGVLIFDGVKWNAIRIANKSTARSLAYDSENDIVYVGAQDEIGYLKPDSIGQLKYISLIDKIPDNERKFGDIWKTIITTDGIVFQSFTHLFLWSKNKIKVLKPQNQFHRSFFVNNKTIVTDKDHGLYFLQNGKLEMMANGKFFSDKKIYAAFSYSQNAVMLCSRNNGLFIYEKGKITPFKTNFDKTLLNGQIYHGLTLSNNTFLIGTLRNGIFHFDRNGHLLKNINEGSQIGDRKIYHLHEDKYNGIWATLNNGIVKVELLNPLTIQTNKQGLKGKIRSIIRHKGTLFIGNSLGLFYMVPKPSPSFPEYVHIPPIVNSTWKLMSLKDGLLAGSGDGLFFVENFNAKKLIDEYAIPYFRSKIDTNLVYIGTLNGVRTLYTKNKKLKISPMITGTEGQTRGIVESSNKQLWISVGNRDLIKIDISKGIDYQNPKINKYNKSHGISTSGRIIPFATVAGIIFSTDKGYYRYNQKQDHFYPDSTLGVSYSEYLDHSYRLRPGKNSNLWRGILNDPIGIGTVNKSGKYDWNYGPFTTIPRNIVRDIYPDKNGIVWFGTTEGLIHYDKKLEYDYNSSFQTIIRKVSLFTGDSLMYGGYSRSSSKKNDKIHKIGYDNNSIHFEFAAPFYHHNEKTLYSYKLEGFEDFWSPWTNKTSKEYTFLHEGDYKFTVKAKNIYGTESEPDYFYFSISPPWYRTLWAIVVFVIINFFVIWGGVKLIIWRLENQKLKLEQLVDRRTTEILQQKEEITAQRDMLDEAYQNIISLSKIGREFTSYLSVEDIIKAVYKNINTLMDAKAFGIGLYNKELERLEFSGFIENQVRLDFHYDKLNENCLSVWCFKKQKEIFINDRESEIKNYINEDTPTKAGGQASSIIYLPLTIKEQKIGVITVQSFNKNAYQPFHINVLQNLAIYAATALENANTYTKLEKSHLNQKELNEFKEIMTNMIIHDFKNDLNTVINFSDGVPSKRRLKSIRQAGRNMLNMVLNILDVQKFEDTEVKLSKSIDPVIKVIEEAIAQVIFLVEQKSIEINYEVDNQLYSRFDYELILRVITNILTNAIKFTPPNGEIQIFTEPIDGFIKIAVQDSGEGIPKNQINEVFDKFAQINPKKTGTVRSTGLGLNFCKLVTEAHGGKIGVFSKEGSGSTFWFTIPICEKEILEEFDFSPKIDLPTHSAIDFTKQEKDFLQPYLKELKQWDVYCYSEINEILSHIEINGQDKILLWKEMVEKVLLNMNQDKYEELINI